jgi:hypothetical protein
MPRPEHRSPIPILLGRAIAQAVRRRFRTAAARVQAQFRSCEICGGESGTGAGFLRGLRFPLPVLIPPTAPHSSSVIRGWYNMPVSGGRTKWTQVSPHPKKLKNVCMYVRVGHSSLALAPRSSLIYYASPLINL